MLSMVSAEENRSVPGSLLISLSHASCSVLAVEYLVSLPSTYTASAVVIHLVMPTFRQEGLDTATRSHREQMHVSTCIIPIALPEAPTSLTPQPLCLVSARYDAA